MTTKPGPNSSPNPGQADRLEVAITRETAGGRLDKVLSQSFPAHSRTRIKALIEAGSVTLEGARVTEPSQRVKPGEVWVIIVPPTAPARPAAQFIALNVVHEDDQLIVIDKPAGLVVHPAPGNPDRTLVNALIAHCGPSLSGLGGEARPGIVHRLDKNTSGLMVAAKNDLAHRHLAGQFAEHSLERAYNAVVWGMPAKKKAEISANIGRDRRNRKKMAVVKRGGKPASTGYQVIRVLDDGAASLLECRLRTGRTHQIRVHLASIGHPVIGDPQYGRARKRRLANPDSPLGRAAAIIGRQALHAFLIGFTHPTSGERLVFRSELPSDINALLSTSRA